MSPQASASLSYSRIYLLSLRNQRAFPIPFSISASYFEKPWWFRYKY